MSQDRDTALIQAIAQGEDRQAFEALSQTYSGELYSFAVHLLGQGKDSLAEDAVQEALLALWQGAGSFDPANGQPRHWLRRILVTKVLKIRRRAARYVEKLDHFHRVAKGSAAGDSAGVGSVENREVLAQLSGSLKQLPEMDRQLVVLYYGADFSQGEIASMFGMPQRSVSGKIARTIERLRAELARAGFAAMQFLSHEAIRLAIDSGHAAPSGLVDAALRRLETHAPAGAPSGPAEEAVSSAGISRSAWQGRNAGLFPLLTACGIACAVLIAAYADGGPPKNGPERPLANAGRAEPAVTANPAIPVHPSRFTRTWNFDTPGQLKDFEQLRGSVQEAPDRGRNGGGGSSSRKNRFSDFACLPAAYPCG